MRPYILAETNWKHLEDADIDLVILPWGATEAHNYHMPYGTDVYEAGLIAAEAARIAWEAGTKLVVLPVVPFGVNTGQADIRLDINLNPTTQLAILNDIIEVLNRQGMHKMIILNSHGGNDFKWMIRQLGLKFPQMFVSTCNWFQALDKAKYFEHEGDHADEMETSLIQYLKPGLVLPLDEAGDGKERKMKMPSFAEKWVWAERKWSQISADTGVGYPKAATKEKGEKFFTDVTAKVAKMFGEVAACDINDLYE